MTFELDAAAQAAADRPVVALVGQVGRVGRARRERRQALGLERLQGKGRRDAERKLAHPLGIIGRDEHLHQIDAGVAAAEDAACSRTAGVCRVLVGRVHAAIAVEGDADRGGGVKRLAVGHVGHEEEIVGAFHRAGAKARRDETGPRGRITAIGHEQADAHLELPGDVGNTGRVERHRHGVLGIGYAGAAECVLHRAIAELEIALGRPRRSRQPDAGRQADGSRKKPRPQSFHLVSLPSRRCPESCPLRHRHKNYENRIFEY